MNSYSDWYKFVKEGILSDEIVPLIKETWQISKDNNVCGLRRKSSRDVLESSLLMERKRKQNQDFGFINKYMLNIAKGISIDCKFTILLTDAEGYALRRVTYQKQQQRKALGLLHGENWSLRSIGTTALGITLKDNIPIWVKNYEHYQERFHKYISIAVPINNAEGKLIYVLGIMINDAKLLRIIYALLMTAVQGIEKEIVHLEYQKRIEDLNIILDKQKSMYKVQTNLLNHIFDNVSDMIFTMNMDRQFIKVNRSAEGFIAKNSISSVYDIYRELNLKDGNDHRLAVEDDPVCQVFNGVTTKDFEICIEDRNHEKQYFLMDALPYYDVEGNTLSIGILKDITHFKKTLEIKEKYKQKAQELENIINTISEGVAIVNSSGEYTLINPACDEIFEYTRHIDKNSLKAGMTLKYGTVSKIDGTPVKQEEYPAFRVLRGEIVQNEIYRIEVNENIKYISFSGKPVYNEAGELQYSVISFSDVTRLQKQKNRIQQQIEFIKSIMDGLGAPVAVLKYPGLEVELVNEVFYKVLYDVLGYQLREEEVIGKPLHEVIPDKDLGVVEILANKAFKAKIKEKAETISFQLRDGTLKHLHVICTPFNNVNSRSTRLTFVGMDVTNEIQAKKSVEAMSKVREEYFTILSHELRSPIAVIHFAIQMLLSDYYINEFSSGTLKMLKKIEKNSLRLLRLVNNFLDISRVEAGYMSVSNSNTNIVGLTEALLESILPIATKKKIDIQLYKCCDIKNIEVDVEKYERVFLNIVSNAFKFTEPGGRVEVILDEDEENILVAIKDNGMGIPEDKQDKIFNRFYIVDGSLTRRSEGSGIGLSLVRKLLDLMKGKIEVQSKVGVGSEFKIYLPKESSDRVVEGKYTECGENIADKIYMEFADVT